MRKKFFFILLLILVHQTHASEKIFKSLEEKQYAVVNIDLESNDLPGAMDSFEEFLKLPEDIKQSIKHKLYPKHRRSDMGFYVRDRKKGHGDTKVFFHYHPILKKKFPDLIKNNKAIGRFFEHADALWIKSHDRVKKILLSLEDRFPGAHDRVFKTSKGQEVHLTLRFLKYDIKRPGIKLARSHLDVGVCTLALGESDPGLRIGTCEEDLKLVKHEPGKAIFFLSKNVEQLLGKKSTLKPGWHDVIPVNINPEKPVQRWAIVAFFDAQGATGGTIEETHTNPAGK